MKRVSCKEIKQLALPNSQNSDFSAFEPQRSGLEIFDPIVESYDELVGWKGATSA